MEPNEKYFNELLNKEETDGCKKLRIVFYEKEDGCCETSVSTGNFTHLESIAMMVKLLISMAGEPSKSPSFEEILARMGKTN